jgi:hypothetical protein
MERILRNTLIDIGVDDSAHTQLIKLDKKHRNHIQQLVTPLFLWPCLKRRKQQVKGLRELVESLIVGCPFDLEPCKIY